GAGEEPVVAGIRAGVGVHRVAHVHGADSGPGLTVHTCDRSDGRGVRIAVIGGGQAGVGHDYDRRGRFADAIADRRVANVVVVGGAGEEPVVAGIRAGVGVGSVAHVHAPYRRICFAVHTGDRRHGRGVRVTVVGRGEAGVPRDYDRGVRLLDS